MTKKHFELAAKLVREAPPSTRYHLLVAFLRFFRTDGGTRSAFDDERFIGACCTCPDAGEYRNAPQHELGCVTEFFPRT